MATTTATAPPKQARRQKRLPAFEQFFAFRRLAPPATTPALTFTPDSRSILFSTDISGQFNIWRVSRAGGAPKQLTTFEDESVRTVTVSPDGKTIVFTADPSGDEFHQIYALPVRGGWPEPWTDAEQVQHFFFDGGWSPDGSQIAYSANSRVPTDQDVWLRDVDTGETRMLLGELGVTFPVAWSPDGRFLTVLEIRSNADSSVHLVAVHSGDIREVTPHSEDDEAAYIPGPWAQDSSGFYLITNEGREFAGLAFYRLDGDGYEWLETPERELEDLAGSRDGRVIAWLENEDGWSRLRIRDVETGRDLPDPQLPAGTATPLGSGLTLSPDGSYAAVVWQSPRRPPELYAIATATGRAKRLTDTMLGGLRERELASPELISYASFDGRRIPAWLYKPRKRGRIPVVLSIHGGPQVQERPIYNGFYQYLASRGIAVLATNIRGSAGYGKTYQKLISRDWGGGDLKDWDHAAKWLLEQSWVDPKRVAVFGGSYGGFASLSCVTRLPDYWAAAVDIFGPSNLVTFAKAVPPTWRRLIVKEVGDPETEADFLLERSPITYVENVKAPLLVIQGATDPRVVKAESDQMVEKLRSLGREVEYVVFEDEGHGFTRRANQLRAWRLSADWLEKYLV
jgi:dipeptidyl aminopeptidase/acylaminoacyl peptidase